MSIGTKLLIIFLVMSVAWIITVFIGIRIESKNYNNGICPRCGGSFKLFDHDSRGG